MGERKVWEPGDSEEDTEELVDAVMAHWGAWIAADKEEDHGSD